MLETLACLKKNCTFPLVNDGLHSPETNDTADTNEEGEEPLMFDRKTSLAKDPQSDPSHLLS